MEGDEYLLLLTRYVHLNPVRVGAMAKRPVAERREHLRRYAWSSYGGYAGLEARNKLVDYGPVLALVGGRGGGVLSA